MSESSVEHVSDTALWVATHRAEESERSDALYKDPLARKLAGERGRQIAKSMPYSKITGWIMSVRTVAIDRLIHEAIAEGVDTVINLGAGLDARPYRLDVPKGLRWIEVDFPHLIDFKNQTLVAEKPKCDLKRLSLDLSQRPDAQKLYGQLGKQAKKALILTEGVVPYLTAEVAGNLAEDLRSVPTFAYWIQDYRRWNERWGHPEKLKRKMAKSPIQFKQEDPLAFFASRGWAVKHDILAIEEGERLGRKFPMPFPGNLWVRFLPKEKLGEFRRSMGYVLLQRS